ncbi:MAG: alpha-amylase family glycosyl hydrolase [Verrucomicrobiota bacterium]
MADNTPPADPSGILSGSDIDFRSRTIYFLVTDRFASGSPGKLREDDELFDASQQDWRKYWGGDLQGIIDKLPYLESLGISAIWTTPLFEQVQALSKGECPQAPIHGYWTSDFKRINPRWMNDPSEKRLFQRDDTVFDTMLAELHKRGMKFVLDIVCNHSSPETEIGKGKLYDDGKLIADFENDTEGWYHHYGETRDWNDEWQVQNGELAGLASFNENNIRFRNHIKESIKLWIDKGVDALRVDTVKHMPLWFWQEFCADMDAVNPALFRFGEWIHSHPQDQKTVDFANRSGMTILDFGFCHAVRDALVNGHDEGFHRIKTVLDQDGKYIGATELVTFFENHDMARLQSAGASDEVLHLALVLLLTSRGIPCLYYGVEQYLHDDTDGGHDPYNRPVMERWDETPATALIGTLARERAANTAIQWGGQWPLWIDHETYVYLRRYRDSRCLVAVNKGPDREIEVPNVDFPDGSHKCLLTGRDITVAENRMKLKLAFNEAVVIVKRGEAVAGKSVIRVQINCAPTEPGDRLAIIGDCPELGSWNLENAVHLECVNANTWFGELVFDESLDQAVGYKYVIFPASEGMPVRENRGVRRRLAGSGTAKWRDYWED